MKHGNIVVLSILRDPFPHPALKQMRGYGGKRQKDMKWIDIKKQTPKKEDCGKSYLIAVKFSTRHEYQVAEWFDPKDEESEPYFLVDYVYCGQQPLNQEVTHWAEIIDLPSV